MPRSARLIVCLLALVCGGAPTADAATLIEQNTAGRLGLVRAWHAQVGAPRSSGPVAHLFHDDGLLLVQSTRGLITALDAETGRALWSAQAGHPDHLSTEPSANAEFVAVVTGSILYVFDRATGKLLWQRPLGGAPGAGAGITATHAFVPMVNGRIEGYDLKLGAKQTPWIYKSAGRVLVPPVGTDHGVAWTTELGYFYVADGSGAGVRYRLETRDSIHARPAHWTPAMYAGSVDGYLYAVDAAEGHLRWKLALGDAVYAAPVVIRDKLYVASQFAGLHCLDTAQGKLLWTAPAATRFVAASPTRLYVGDRRGRLVVLDGASGAQLGALPLSGIAHLLPNTSNDRIYLAGDNCVVQCLRERELTTPVAYVPPQPEEAKVKRPAGPRRGAGESDAQPADQPAADAAAADEPAGDQSPPADMPPDDAPPAAPPADEGDDPFR